ncbi:hypothetical protein [Nocardioides sp. SYSU DS0663]|uniref:hypothetical protein n=1 Tax=Nocardioides sp. SYSU DS0663 TaxID=3416445 RepID=UPI003F4B367D
MSAANVTMLVVGVLLAAWTTRQHLGRSRRARAWGRAGARSVAERTNLVVHPLLAALLILAGLGNDQVEPAGAGAIFWAGVALCLLLLGAYIILPLPIPDAVKPRWYRDMT